MASSTAPIAGMRTAGKAALLFVAFLSNCYLTVMLSRHTGSFAVVWPADAVVLGVLLLSRPREWPACILAAGAGNFAAIMLAGDSALTALGFAASNMTELVVAATTLHRFRAPSGWLTTVKSLMLLLGIAGILAPAIGASISAAVGHLSFHVPYLLVWRNRLIADTVGMLVIVPLLLAWLRGAAAAAENRRRPQEAFLIATGLIGATALTLIQSDGSLAANHMSLILALPFQIWATLRFGARGATIANAFVGLAGIAAILAAGATPPGPNNAAETLIALQALLAATSLSTLLLAAALDERRAAEKRLRDAFDSIGAGFALFDADDRLVLSNSMHQRMYAKNADLMVPGVRFEDILRGSVARGQHPDATGRVDAWVKERLQRHLNPGDPIEQDRGDGQWLLICERRTSDGGIVGTWTDISRQKAQEETLRRNDTRLRQAEVRARAAEERLRDVIESMNEGLTAYDADGRLVLTNRRTLEIYPTLADVLVPGATFEDFLRQGVARGVFDTGGAPMDAFLAEHAALPTDRRKDLEADLTDGRWLLVSRQRTSDGGMVHVRTDITRLKQQERALRENEERLRLAEARLRDAIEQLDEAFVLFDSDDRLVLCNEKFRQICDESVHPIVPGITFETIVRDRAEGGFVADAVGRVEEWVAERMQRHRNPTSAFELQQTDGRWLLIADRRTADGGYVGIRTEITRLKHQERELKDNEDRLRGMLRELEESHAKLERQSFMLTKLAEEAAVRGQQAQAANTAKSQFLANISHELRTPLNAILGFSEIMKGEMLGPLGSRQYRGYAADIHDSGTLLLSVIDDLLDLSKIEAGKYELHEQDCRPESVLRDAVRIVAERANSAGVRIHLRPVTDLPGLRADNRLIKQVLLNLLSNSIKFTPSGGTITLAAAVDAEGSLSLSVADTGIGIPGDQLERVLQPFVQVENIMTRSHTGTGLGLPLCKALMDLHGGRLTLASEPGNGTVATISFPRERSILSDDHGATVAASAA